MKYVIPLCLAALVGSVVIADDVKVKAGRDGVAVDVNRNADDTSPKVLHKGAHAMRLSEMTGLEVRNEADEVLGKIEDVVVDLKTGKIRYAAISMGGFLGIGDKLFAVPFESITFRTHREDGVLVDTTERIAVVNINKETLENAQGFDNDKWPNMADRRWQELNDRPYRTGARTQPDDPVIDR
ncbi:MAG: PRC-barrel domain-containing protein [Pirellulales bacterium]